jgi:predicted transcriptional regulator
MASTTIKLDFDTKRELDSFREYKNESYDEVVSKLLYIAKNLKENPELSEETIAAIDAARTRIKKGNFVSEKDAMDRLGF